MNKSYYALIVSWYGHVLPISSSNTNVTKKNNLIVPHKLIHQNSNITLHCLPIENNGTLPSLWPIVGALNTLWYMLITMFPSAAIQIVLDAVIAFDASLNVSH